MSDVADHLHYELPVVTRQEMHRICERHIAELRRDYLDILEAGCGRYWRLNLGNASKRITGVDLDRDAMAFRQATYKDLDEGIVGDIATVDLQPASFDVIYCSFLLEHVPDVTRVLENFTRWLKPGGEIIFTIPDRNSVHGFCTRMSPHWFHVWYKRWFSRLGRNSGKPGFGPYRTYYDPALSEHAIHDFCAANGLRITEIVGFNVDVRSLWLSAFIRTVSALSFGHLAWKHNDLLYVLCKG